MVGKITYSYQPKDWPQEEFLRLGGFTVVFLNYNKAAYIEQSVASALAQDFPLCEMFFMDDASTDGSGDTMERLAREYRGPHKVTVVRNERNLGITGQWNQVAKLATGNWFGMFCADDLADLDRVSKVAKVVSAYPDLLGVCTNGSLQGSAGRMFDEQGEWLVSSENLSEELKSGKMLVAGATAFWHRSLFDEPLPKGPLDDEILLFRLLSRLNGGSAGFCFSFDVSTIAYSTAGGVSSGNKEMVEQSDSARIGWLKRTHSIRHYSKTLEKTLRSVVHSQDYRRASVALKRDVVSRWRTAQIVSGTTLSRALLLPGLIVEFCRRRVDLSQARMLLLLWAKKFVHEFFGLYVASLSACVR